VYRGYQDQRPRARPAFGPDNDAFQPDPLGTMRHAQRVAFVSFADAHTT
jgi:hypothetical protein